MEQSSQQTELVTVEAVATDVVDVLPPKSRVRLEKEGSAMKIAFWQCESSSTGSKEYDMLDSLLGVLLRT